MKLNMKFIFPRNYNFKMKLFGVFDYFTIIINIIFDLFVFSISSLLFSNINVRIFLCITLCFPLLILSIVGLNNENIFLVLIYIAKYFIRPKLYLYNKTNKL